MDVWWVPVFFFTTFVYLTNFQELHLPQFILIVLFINMNAFTLLLSSNLKKKKGDYKKNYL